MQNESRLAPEERSHGQWIWDDPEQRLGARCPYGGVGTVREAIGARCNGSRGPLGREEGREGGEGRSLHA